MQAREFARTGRVPAQALPELTAYADWRRFGVMPLAGGTFEQPGWLLDGMRLCHGEALTIEQRREREARARAAKK